MPRLIPFQYFFLRLYDFLLHNVWPYVSWRSLTNGSPLLSLRIGFLGVLVYNSVERIKVLVVHKVTLKIFVFSSGVNPGRFWRRPNPWEVKRAAGYYSIQCISSRCCENKALASHKLSCSDSALSLSSQVKPFREREGG
jgi:hypothetical protein